MVGGNGTKSSEIMVGNEKINDGKVNNDNNYAYAKLVVTQNITAGEVAD